MALTREAIVLTAAELVDQYGLGDLSMRRLATELGVAPGALYWHLTNKQELLGHLARLACCKTRPLPPGCLSRPSG